MLLRLFASIVAFLLTWPVFVFAEDKTRLDRRDELLGWESVGRLDFGHAHCTAVLVERDTVLTAAHCVPGADSGTISTYDMVFRAGYRDGQQIAIRHIRDAVVPDAYIHANTSGNRSAQIANDVALLRLTSPIYEPGADPYGISSLPTNGAKTTLASYGKGRIEALTLERGCALTQRYVGDIASFDCDATFGSSGAPVFARVQDRIRIVSIISSGTDNGDGSMTALGMNLTRLVPELRRELRNRSLNTQVTQGARRLTVGERSSTGARFVKP